MYTNILAVPMFDRTDRVFGIVQLLNKAGELPFDEEDERRLSNFAAALGVVLESWCRMRERRTALAAAAVPERADVTGSVPAVASA